VDTKVIGVVAFLKNIKQKPPQNKQNGQKEVVFERKKSKKATNS
jgi:hypothetical protein